MKNTFILLALAAIFFSAVSAAFAAEAVTNGVLNSTANWTLTTGIYDAGTTRTADGSGSTYVNAVGRNNRATATLTQTLSTPIPVGSTIDTVVIYAQTTGSGTYGSSAVTIDLEYSDLSTLNVFTGTMPAPTYTWSDLLPNTATLPVTTSGTLEVTAVIVTFEMKNGNDNGADYRLYVDDISVAYTAPAGNNLPVLTISQPDGVGDSVTQGASFNVNYDLSDTEDAATVDFYYETDGNGAGGTPIATCQNQPKGAGLTCGWDTTSVTPADYYVYGVADDLVNAVVTVVSSGVLTINAPLNTPPNLTVNQPAGGDDSVTQGATFNVDYDLSDTEDAATVDFYYETDGNGAGGTPIANCQNQPKGAGLTCGWDTTSVTLADYYVYGVADDGVNAVVTVVSSGVLTINAPAGTNNTVAGTATASAGNAVIDVSAPYTGDDNTDNSITISWGEGDCLTGNQTSGVHPASPYIYQISGLINGKTYQVCVDYNDSDGVTGVDPQTLIGLTPISYNPMVHSSLSTGSSKWGGDWGTATGKYGEFSCSTCHARKTGNIKRIKKSLNSGTADKFPIELDVGTVNFFDMRDGSSDFGNDLGGHAVSDMICEGCHSQNKYHNYNTANNLPGGDLTHENLQDCVSCHQHSKGFGASCDTCHGNPPVTNDTSTTGLVFDPATTDATNPVSAGGHSAHAVTLGMACITCHKGNTMPTVSNSIQMGFEVNNANWSGFGDTATTGTLDAPNAGFMSASYSFVSSSAGTTIAGVDNNNLTCAVYCHGDWTGNGGQTATSWVGGSTIADDCNDCHGGVAATPPTAGSHQKHAGNGAGDLALDCTNCHSNYSDTAHLDGNVAWDVTALSGTSPLYSGSISGATGGKAPSATYGSCAGIYCHSDGVGTGGAPVQAPVWGNAATGECGDCHAIAPATNAHPEHYTAKSWTADGSNCGTCHDETAGNHVNSTVNVLASLGWDGGAKTCSTTSTGCHNATTTPSWDIGSPITCSQCHTVDGSNTATVANPVSGLHGNTVAAVQDHDASLTGGCEACHVKASISGHWNGTASATADYTKAAVGITSAMYTDAAGTAATRGSCLSNTDLATCHTDGGEWRRLWSTAADADISIATGDPLPGQAVCNVCHGQFSTLTASTGWNEGTVHYRSGSGVAEDKGTIHTDAGDECEDCHGYDSAATHNSNNAIDFSDGGGSYTITLNTDRWYCATCHNAKLGEDPALTGTHTFFDSLAFPNSVAHVTGTSEPEGDCFGCHGDGVAEYWPQSVGTNQRDLTTDASYNDDGRHSLHIAEIATRLGYALPGDDAQQREMCGYCHTVEDGDHMTKGNNENADVFTTSLSLWGAVDADANYDEPTDTCATVDCHNSKLTTDDTYGWYDADAGVSNCVMCHTRATSGNNPSSGLHYGSTAPTVSSTWHDDSITGGCEACHDNLPANGVASTHIDSTFQGGNGQKVQMGLFADYIQTADNIGTCATTCHSGAGDNGTWARVWNSGIHYVSDGNECKGCHGGFGGADWTFGTDDVDLDGSVSHNKDWNGDATANEIIGNHDASNDCNICHVYDGTDTVYKWATHHRDGDINMNSTMGYSRAGTDDVSDCATTCHSDPNNLNHGLEQSGWALATIAGPALSCTGCHGTAASGAGGVGADSPHTDADGAGGTYTSGICTDCHAGHADASITGDVIITNATLANISVSFSHGGISLGGTGTASWISSGMSDEADVCWACHAGNGQGVSEWGKTWGAYDTGTLSGTDWTTSTWTSANFAYKTDGTDGGDGNIRSTHGVDGGAAGVDTVGELSCTLCHDVHDTGGGANDGLKPYLRGTWISNPFPEDGAPQTTAHATVWGGVPRAGLGSSAVTTPNTLGGWQIEQNNSGAYANGNTYEEHSGLCSTCHAQATIETAWSGHAAAVDGFSGTGEKNIYSTANRGGAGFSDVRGYMMNNNSTAQNNTKGYPKGLRSEYYTNTYTPLITVGADPTDSGIVAGWSFTVDDTTTDTGFHQFPCSKCHNPHASRLEKLMITNCLDVRHNKWDDTNAGDPSSWSGVDGGTTGAYTAKQLAYSPTAANCHRYVDGADANRETNGSNENGWNSVTPW